jgi:hypothetical protein
MIFSLRNILFEVKDFINRSDALDTVHYVNSMMELIYGILSVLPISLLKYKEELSREIFYKFYYQLIEEILKCIINRAERSESDIKNVSELLFDMLKPYSEHSLAKILAIDKIYEQRKEIMDLIMHKK